MLLWNGREMVLPLHVHRGGSPAVIKTSAVLIAAFAHAVFAAQPADARPAIEHVFVIVMENATAAQIYGNVAGAP